MKKILLLLLFTLASYGQAVFDEGIQITNTESATATKVNVQEANGKVNTQAIKTGFNKNIGLGGSDVVGANTLLNQYATTPSDWTAQSYVLNSVVFYGGKQWIAKTATVAGDVPAVSPKWEEITFEALANKTVTVDQTIIDGSTNAVSGNAVFDGLALKSNIGHTHVASQITDLSKASVGLGNVDNTSDLSKPLSTATINALATKAPISSVHNPVTLGTANGLSLSTQQLSLGLASSGVTGALSGTDWNTFNGKFNTPAGLTTNYLPKWNGSGFGNSSIFDNGTNIGIGTTNPTANLTVKGAYSVGSSIPANWALLSAGRMGVANNNKGLYLDIFNGYAEVSTYDWSLGQAYPMVFQGNGGNSMFGTNVDNGSKVQVNGTISASPATTANQVVVKSQLDAVASSGIFTPTTSSLTNLNYANPIIGSSYIKIGNIVYVSIRFGIKAAAAGGAYFNITLPFNRTLTSQLNQIGLANLDDGAGYGIVYFPPSTNNVCRVFLTINQLGDRVGVANFQYSISE